jgi:hypothetical protein
MLELELIELTESIKKIGERQKLFVDVLLFLLLQGTVSPPNWPGDTGQCASEMSEALIKAKNELKGE